MTRRNLNDLLQEFEKQLYSQQPNFPLLNLTKLTVEIDIDDIKGPLFNVFYKFKGALLGTSFKVHDHYRDDPLEILADAFERQARSMCYSMDAETQALLAEQLREPDIDENDSHHWIWRQHFPQSSPPSYPLQVCHTCDLKRTWVKDDFLDVSEQGRWVYEPERRECPTLKGLAKSYVNSRNHQTN